MLTDDRNMIRSIKYIGSRFHLPFCTISSNAEGAHDEKRTSNYNYLLSFIGQKTRRHNCGTKNYSRCKLTLELS